VIGGEIPQVGIPGIEKFLDELSESVAIEDGVIDPDNCVSPGFNRLTEAIEGTALRRQGARWSA
jgi:hypothetical protein